MKRKPDTENVVFLDEYPQFVERQQAKQALGQLTLIANTPPGQLYLFPQLTNESEGAA